MNSNDKDVFGCIGVLTFGLLAVVFGSITNGWALSVMWKWFIVSTFNAPSISIAQAIGLSLVVGFFTFGLKKNETKGKSKIELMVEIIGNSVFVPLLFVGIAWIIYQFI